MTFEIFFLFFRGVAGGSLGQDKGKPRAIERDKGTANDFN
jgi:hypothetical protein